MLQTEIKWMGRQCLAVCDHKCEKAWGEERRPIRPSALGCEPAPSFDFDDMDDYVMLPDHEVGISTVVMRELGEHPDRHTRWCVRECERSSVIEAGEEIAYRDFRYPFYNQPDRHPDDEPKNRKVKTGVIFRPNNIAEE